MIIIKKLSGVIGLVLLAQMLSAQVHDHTLSVADLVSSVTSKAPSLIADSAAVSIRQSLAKETKYNWLPSMKLNYQADLGTNNNVPGAYFGFGIVPSNTGGVRPANDPSNAISNLGVATLDWEIYNFGLFNAQNMAALADVHVEQQQFRLTKYQLQTSAIEGYLQLFQYQNLALIQQENITRNQQIRSSILALAKSGIIAGVDTSIAEAELSKSRLMLLELTNKHKQLQLHLAAISGIDADKIIADSTISLRLISLSGQMPAPENTAGHPLLNYYQSRYENSLQKEQVIRKSNLPKLLLEGAVWGRGSSINQDSEFGPLNNGWGLSRTNYLVGLGISFNITDIKRQQLRLNTQRSTSSYEQKRLTEQSVNLDFQIKQADAELQTAMARLNEIPRQLSASRAAYRQKFSLYKNGLITIIELNIALNLLYRAEADFAIAKYTLCRAVFQKAITRNQVGLVLNSLK
jgi:adhesin transport system outer membrane protein